MIRRRTMLLLGGAGVASLGAAAWLAPREDAPPLQATPPLAFPGLAERLPAARRVEITRHDAAVTLRLDGVWRVAERANWPARPARLREALTGLTELRLLEPRAPDARNGTDDPATPGATGTRLRVLDGDGAALADVVLGTRRSRAAPGVPPTLHLRRWGEDRAWLAEGAVPADPDPNLWLLRELADIPSQRLRRVEVVRAGEPLLVLQRPGEVDAPLVIVEPRHVPRPDALGLDQAGRAFEALTLHEVRRADTLRGEALGEARFTFTDNLTVRAWGRRDAGALWLVLRAEGDAEALRLNALWEGYAFDLGGFMERALLPRAEDLVEVR